MSGRNYPADTQKQKFFEEFYNKERDTRIAWFLKVHNPDESTTGKSKQYEVFRKKIEGGHLNKPSIGKLPPIQTNQFRRKTLAEIPPGSVPDENKNSVDMKPVPSRIKAKLYDGFSKEGKGRVQYLHDRYLEDPEKKFQYPLLSSWDYGWRLGDVIKKDEIKKPTHGRTRIVMDTFYTRTGVPTLN